MIIHSSVAADSVEKKSSYSIDIESSILTDIYSPNQNIAIWKRTLPAEVVEAVDEMLCVRKALALVKCVSPANAAEYIQDKLSGYDCAEALSEDIALIVDMFCCLFDVEEAGLRLTMLDSAMCPKFHVDQIPCRLVTTYKGIATQWLDNKDIDRSKLGRASVGIADYLSGLFINDLAIQQMCAGDVALLKGSGWEGNESMGLVHRSPALAFNERRLLLTLDLL